MCVEKPLCSLWKNYTCNQKPDVHMKLTITQSGLKAFTKEHGLTEYWSHRVTYCLASPQFPRIFCWVYRHEGRKLKQELRCHAVVCSKESVAKQIAEQLQSRLAQALTEFKRDKISRQNARLSLANCVYENPSLPRRKILLSTGSHNYRPPLERSKSAPRLMSIEESLEEDEESADAAATRGRCRAENRLRTGTLRNRLGGLRGGHAVAAAAETAEPLSVVVGDRPTVADVENRLAQTRLRDDGPADEPAERCVAVEPIALPPSYREVATADERAAVAECAALAELPKYNEVVVECPQGPEDVCYKYNSLVRDRKRLFENGGRAETTGPRRLARDQRFERIGSDSELLLDGGGAYGNLVKNRKLLFEGGRGCCRLRDHHLVDDDLTDELDDEDKDCGYPDDESTPSLQSISSGGSADAKKLGPADLDSLSEEDSDESGYVEAPPSSQSAFCLVAEVGDEKKDIRRCIARNDATATAAHCVSV